MLIFIFGSRVRRKSDSESIRDFHTQEDRVSTSWFFFNIICFTWIENSCIGYPQSPSLQLNIHFRHFWVLLNLLLFPLLDISLPDTIESSLIKSRAKVVISRLLIRHSDWLNFLHFDGYKLRLNSSWDSSKEKFKQWSKYSQF